MASYVVSDTSLTAVADAIREKTGKSAQMSFPDGFVDEIGDISGGGSGNIVIAEGTFTPTTSSVGARFPIGTRMAQNNFFIVITAPDEVELEYNATFKNVVGGVVCSSFLSNGYDLTTEGTDKKATGKRTYTTNNSGTIITFTPDGVMGGGYSMRNNTQNALGYNTRECMITKTATEFSIYLRFGAGQFVAGITYSYQIVYFGSNSATDIVTI